MYPTHLYSRYYCTHSPVLQVLLLTPRPIHLTLLELSAASHALPVVQGWAIQEPVKQREVSMVPLPLPGHRVKVTQILEVDLSLQDLLLT